MSMNRRSLAWPILLAVPASLAVAAWHGGVHIPTARLCDRAVLLYDSGRVRQGRIAEMLTQDNLELLYQCRLEPAGGPDAMIFVPR